MDRKLSQLRARIDDLDTRIQALLNERARCALDVAAQKAADGDDVFYRPEREAQVLKRVTERSTEPMGEEEMLRLFREIMSACLALESPLTIAYLGPEGTFTQAAALKQFGHSVRTASHGAIDEVFRDVEAGNANFGVVPIENSTEGVVNHTLDLLLHSPLKICGEVEFRIHHHLLGAGPELRGIERVVSHQQSLAQCREWLAENLPDCRIESASSNAEAARLVQADPAAAAIAGDMAARTYGLNILARNVEDHPENTTRFLVLGKRGAGVSGNDKTSLVLSRNNRPGALYELLEPFGRHDISMTRIESRPARTGLWEYVFFVDVDGHVQDAPLAAALEELREATVFIKHLGSYPKAML